MKERVEEEYMQEVAGQGDSGRRLPRIRKSAPATTRCWASISPSGSLNHSPNEDSSDHKSPKPTLGLGSI